MASMGIRIHPVKLPEIVAEIQLHPIQFSELVQHRSFCQSEQASAEPKN